MKRLCLKQRRGTSLVEILAAMAILLLGILAIIQVFPGGFTSILYGRSVSQAQMLTRGMIEAAGVRYAEMPSGVIAMDPSTGFPNPLVAVKEDLGDYPQSPNVLPDPRFSDVNKARRVIGETTKIPPPSTNSPYMPVSGAAGERLPVSPFILNFSPIYSVTPTKASQGVLVYSGTPLNRIVYQGTPDATTLASIDLFSYGIDYSNARLYFSSVNYPRIFRIQYSFRVAAGADGFAREFSRPGAEIAIPANVASFDLPLPAQAQLEQESDQVFRGFRLLGPNEPFSADPYEYKVLNRVVGVIGFNPLGAAVQSAGAMAQPLTAKIDYDVDDWHIIREDRQISASPPFAVKLALNGIEKIGAMDEHQERYNGLMRDYPGDRLAPDTHDIDLLVVDMDTGLTIDSRTLQRADRETEVAGNDLNGEINYLDGAITFRDQVSWTLPAAGGPAGSPESIAGKHLRIYYRTPQNWALQFTKAFDRYVPRDIQDINSLGYGEYSQGTQGYLFFPVADQGGAVLVDYTWQHRVGNQVILRTETGEYHQISDPTLPESPQNLFGSPVPYWWTVLDGAHRPDAVDGSVRVLRVRGVSVRARAIWREGTRWRRLDLDSYVGRDRGT